MPREPSWWYGAGDDWRIRALRWPSSLYARAAVGRLARPPERRVPLPVICIGNFTAGGTGKTPLALHVAAYLAGIECRPVFLTRGYGGLEPGPRWVDPARDTARAVGDEPLLLAMRAPTMLARDRAKGADAIVASGRGDAIIMDDGLQNPALAKDLTIAVVDGRRGIGNGRVMPAGPLRAPLEAQLARTDAIVVNAPAGTEEGASPEAVATADWLRRTFTGPVLLAETAPAGDLAWLAGRPLVAYAGIGAPERFFSLLETRGALLADRIAFPDHHAFRARDARRLLDLAARHGAGLVTTEKDLARLGAPGGVLGDLAGASRALAVEIRFSVRDGGRLATLIEQLVRGARASPGARGGHG